MRHPTRQAGPFNQETTISRSRWCPQATTCKPPGVLPTPQSPGAPAAQEKKPHWPMQKEQAGIQMQRERKPEHPGHPSKAQGTVCPVITASVHRARTMCWTFC